MNMQVAFDSRRTEALFSSTCKYWDLSHAPSISFLFPPRLAQRGQRRLPIRRCRSTQHRDDHDRQSGRLDARMLWNPDIRTPRIDQLARDGLLFSQCYSSKPRGLADSSHLADGSSSIPTRSALLCGTVRPDGPKAV
jgi:hypothetical protein